jgi:uncharacterized OB-fold protein
MGTQMSEDGRPLPLPNPTTQPYFDAALDGRLRLQRCPKDGFFFYPRSRCPKCLGDDWSWEDVSGRGSLHAFTIDRIGHDPALARDVPFAIAVIELEEGPRMTARVVDCELDELQVGMALEATFETIDDVALVRFRPSESH